MFWYDLSGGDMFTEFAHSWLFTTWRFNRSWYIFGRAWHMSALPWRTKYLVRDTKAQVQPEKNIVFLQIDYERCSRNSQISWSCTWWMHIHTADRQGPSCSSRYSSTSVPCDSIGVSVLLFNQIEHCWSRGGGSGGDTAGLALNKRFFKDEHHRHSVQVHVWSHYPTGR